MPVSNSFKILFNNFAIIYKVLLYKFIALIISASVVLTFAYGSIKSLNTAGAFSQFSAVFKGDSLQDVFVAIKAALENFWLVLKSVDASVAGTFIFSAFAFLFISLFLINLDKVAQCEVIYAKLSANCKLSYSGSFIKKLWLACVYSLFKTVWLLVFNAIIIISVIALSKLLDINGFLGIISPFIMIFVVLALIAIYFTLFGGFAASCVAEDEKILKRFFVCIKMALRTFFKMLALNFLLISFVVFINYVFASVFMGIFLIVTIPFSFVLISVFHLVCYFENSGNRYYINPQTIITPKKNEYYDKVKDLINLI